MAAQGTKSSDDEFQLCAERIKQLNGIDTVCIYITVVD